jgi:hypothetical protein
VFRWLMVVEEVEEVEVEEVEEVEVEVEVEGKVVVVVVWWCFWSASCCWQLLCGEHVGGVC